jgi:allophanate hydrolase subunit 2
VQGAPKFGLRAFGVPPGGAWDPIVQRALNEALSNGPNSFVLELAVFELTLAAQELVTLAWRGATVGVSVDGINVPRSSCQLHAGQVIKFGPPISGARLWVGASGGFVPRSSEPLVRGEVLKVNSSASLLEPSLDDFGYDSVSEIRVIPDRPEFGNLFKNAFIVRHDSNRVGIRLDGPKMTHQLELPSEPATPGVVQITREGLPIILGPDGPTIGGYPRAGVVISVDVPKLAQLKPGDSVRFTKVSIKAAREFSQ